MLICMIFSHFSNRKLARQHHNLNFLNKIDWPLNNNSIDECSPIRKSHQVAVVVRKTLRSKMVGTDTGSSVRNKVRSLKIKIWKYNNICNLWKAQKITLCQVEKLSLQWQLLTGWWVLLDLINYIHFVHIYVVSNNNTTILLYSDGLQELVMCDIFALCAATWYLDMFGISLIFI